MPHSPRPNVLFLSIEDLNDYVEPLGGHPQVVTPNITRLAGWGHLFKNAQASAPACSPSRTAVLFGRQPWQSGIYTNRQTWPGVFERGRDFSIPGMLRKNGFATHGAGKMFYGGLNPDDWDDYLAEPNDVYQQRNPLTEAFGQDKAKLNYGPSEKEGPLYDERNAEYIMQKMQPGMEGQVWSLGLYRPHLPFIAPKRFFDLYPENVAVAPALKERIFDPSSDEEAAGLPPEPMRRIVHEENLGEKLHKMQQYNAFIRAYLASISYADHVLGTVLDRLEEAGLRDNTFVVLWSDHGFHFGEKQVFRKFTLWERSLRTPMIFAGPGIGIGSTDRPVSNIDLGPTLFKLLGIDPGQDWQGTDLTPILAGEHDLELPPIVSVYSWQRRGLGENSGDIKPYVLAWTVRDSRWRFVRYWRGGIELYDHSVDPYEHHNLAPGGKRRRLPAEFNAVVEALEAHIPTEWAEPVDRVKSAPDLEDPDSEDSDSEDVDTENARQELPLPTGSGAIPHWSRMLT
jgi:arylsulfatase A-like enzyme